MLQLNHSETLKGRYLSGEGVFRLTLVLTHPVRLAIKKIFFCKCDKNTLYTQTLTK